jgi:hypothetical protein
VTRLLQLSVLADHCVYYAELFAGLTPVLEAVAELPAGGLPIPSAAQQRVRQFIKQQLGRATAELRNPAGTSGTNKPEGVLPEGLQAVTDLAGHLQQLSYNLWSQGQCKLASPIVSAAVQLVADASCFVARQQKTKPDTPAYGLLLSAAYRAGEAG